MKHGKKRVVPIIFTIVILVVIIGLFVSFKQPLVVCSNRVKNEFDIVVLEELETTINNKKIESMILVKTIVLPDKYLKDKKYLDNIVETLEKSYAYLDKEKVTITKSDDRVVARVVVDKNETLILNNIKFSSKNDLVMSVNPNTKSSEVLTLRINDFYSEGEFKTRMNNKGYSCN